jgi:hypothetical protein
MDLSTFIIGVFDIVDDFFEDRGPIRRRGPAPKLSDSEVVTMEIVGEFLGIDTQKGIYTYFKRHYSHYFPKIKEIHRTTFTRQAANLWVIKEHLWQHVLEHELAVVLGGEEEEPPLMVIDSLPIPICKKSRSYKCKVMRDVSERGRDTNLGKFLGLRAHVVIRWPGIIVRALASAEPTSTTCARPSGSWRGWERDGYWPTGTTGPRRWPSSCATTTEDPRSWPASSGRAKPSSKGDWCGLDGFLPGARR